MSRDHHTTRVPGLAMTDHRFTVPVDHADPSAGSLTVFAREVVDPAKVGKPLPWLLFLQGGPGGRAPRPAAARGWLRRAVRSHRVLLLDQRGTGRSTPVTARTAAELGPRLASYLAHFRADAIVADAELVRRGLCGDEPWETLGQSYGGFLTLTYLSVAPQGLRSCYITGGLPGLTATADDVYARTYPRVRAKVDAFYARHPGDADRVRRIADLLPVALPDGDRLTLDRLRTLGFALGTGDGAERLHWLLEQAFDGDGLSDAFLYEVLAWTSYAGRPLFATLHESIYGQGGKPTAWAAHRALAAFPEFTADSDPLLLTGEMIYPWMFEDVRCLRPFADAAHQLAEWSEWTPLYDPDRLARNEVPVAAAVYHDDMYVDAGLSLDTAGRVGALRAWVTNEWEHDGVSASGERVLDRLIDMAAGQV
ncbi:alpha/beta fold hydrolase [Saccharothrix australiensis]|uniref:Prolyl aminopeptidase 2 n=1 Tax=Saccharothrix australiensis TaxID=2072 RepID=A0A495W1E9_9PSEU|nr:alpha/beta fold hydrolase [Saccharothrix australiensis]RKT54837.1 prolyl aminopeptidase 2 [Saccharothrix australiensis]